MRYFEYWNDIEIEKAKPYWIEESSDTRLVRFLREETNLERTFLDAISFSQSLGSLKGNVLDVGAGVGWSSAIISRQGSVKSVTAVDFSEHRLNKIAPIVFKQLNGASGKLKIVVGDFLRLEWVPNSFDAAVFVQSLYMFPDPAAALARVRKLLVPGGLLIISCERIIPEHPLFSREFYKQRIGWFIYGKVDASGRRDMVDKDYRKALQRAGFDYGFQPLDYPAFPKTGGLKAGNHFGVKRGK